VSFDSLLVHPLAIVSPTAASPASSSDWNQPTVGTPTTELVRGLVQPRTAREMALSTQAGEPVSDYVIFLPSQRLSQSAYIRDEPDTGRRFEVTGIRSYEYGTVPHLEVDCRLIGQPEGPTVAGS
jgi:hypothetical protein